MSGRHGGASSTAGRGGVSDAGGFGGGGRRGGRGGLGRGRNQWVRQQQAQAQPQPANGGRKVGYGLGTRAARGGTAAGGDEGMDEVHEANGEGSDEDRDGAPMEQDGEGEYDEEYDVEGDDTEVAVPVTAPGPWRGNRSTSVAQSRVPVPSFGEKSPGLDGGEGAEADDEARLRKRRQRFGPAAEAGPSAAGDGGGGRGGSTPPRPSSRSPLRWHQSGPAAGGPRGGGEEGEEETAPGFHRSSLSPPPSPLLPIFMGGGAGGSDALGDDDEGEWVRYHLPSPYIMSREHCLRKTLMRCRHYHLHPLCFLLLLLLLLLVNAYEQPHDGSPDPHHPDLCYGPPNILYTLRIKYKRFTCPLDIVTKPLPFQPGCETYIFEATWYPPFSLTPLPP